METAAEAPQLVLEVPHYILIFVIAVSCFTGIGLQFLAWRHRKPGIPRYGHKDSFFRKKDQMYTEQGMYYIRLQKKLMYIMLGAMILFFIMVQPDQPPPPQ